MCYHARSQKWRPGGDNNTNQVIEGNHKKPSCLNVFGPGIVYVLFIFFVAPTSGTVVDQDPRPEPQVPPEAQQGGALAQPDRDQRQ